MQRNNQSFTTNAQTVDATAIELQMKSIFRSKLQFSVFKDSVAIYGFAFKLELEKVNGKTMVTDLNVNDSIATKIYPNYLLLKDLDYSVILKQKLGQL